MFLQDAALTQGAFLDLVSKDRFLSPELPAWNEECSEVAKELFDHLDRNKDGVVDTNDLQGLEKADLDLWAGKIVKKCQIECLIHV